MVPEDDDDPHHTIARLVCVENTSTAAQGAPWPVETLAYFDSALQRASEPCAFTFADFMLCDARSAAHFALVPREHWNAQMVPAADWLALAEGEAAQRVPYLLAVDGDDALQRVIPDARLMQATRRCLLLWHRLQEHGGVHDSHAERLLAREKAAWAAQQGATTAAAGKDQLRGLQHLLDHRDDNRAAFWLEEGCIICSQLDSHNPLQHRVANRHE